MMTQNQLNKIIDFYKKNLYTKASIEALYTAKKITKTEYNKILKSKE